MAFARSRRAVAPCRRPGRSPAGEPATPRSIAAIVEAVGDEVAVEVAGGLRRRLSSRRPRGRCGARGRRHGGATRSRVRRSTRRQPTASDTDRRRARRPRRMARGRGLGEGAAGVRAEDAWRRSPQGVATFEVTAIDRDGLLGGPDQELLRRLVGLGSRLRSSHPAGSRRSMTSCASARPRLRRRDRRSRALRGSIRRRVGHRRPRQQVTPR